MRSVDTRGSSQAPSAVDYGTRRGGNRPVEPGLADPGWTRLAFACLVPVLLAATAPLPVAVRLALVVILVPLTAQGWPALVRSRHDQRATTVVTVTGLVAALVVAWRHDFGAAGLVMAFSVLGSFVAQMTRHDGREELVEDLSATVTGNLVVVSGAGWCALAPGTADPAVIVPCAIALLTGALLTTLEVRATILEALTVAVPALVAAVVGGVLALVGFFGATQDIVIDAYRVEKLDTSEQAAGMGAYVAAYRIGMLVSTAGALFITSFFEKVQGFPKSTAWTLSYCVMAGFVLIGIATTLFAREPARPMPPRRQCMGPRRRAVKIRSRGSVRRPSARFPSSSPATWRWRCWPSLCCSNSATPLSVP